MAELTRIDHDKNRIYIYFRGSMDLTRAKELKEAYRNAISEVQPGFTVVTFAEDFKPATPDVQQVVQEMTEMASDSGCGKVARVVGETPLGGMQINRLAKVRTKYSASHFKTLEDAEKYLDKIGD